MQNDVRLDSKEFIQHNLRVVGILAHFPSSVMD